MGKFIELGSEGSSVLDKRLEMYGKKDPESGHIFITPEVATSELLQTLLVFYRDTIANAPEPFNETSAKIEALAYIVQHSRSIVGGQTMPFDYTDIKEGYDRKREWDRKQRMENEAIVSIVTPRTRSQAEI